MTLSREPWKRSLRAWAATSSLSVTIAPPSPRQGRFLEGKKEKVAASASDPAFCPPSVAPAAWAASSSTGTPSSRSSGMGATLPNRCTGTIALVRGVSAARTVSAVTQAVSGSTSQNTGTAPMSAAASAVA